MSETQEYIVRVQSNRAWTYGLGKIVSPGVTLFERGMYDLNSDELSAKLKSLGKVVLRA